MNERTNERMNLSIHPSIHPSLRLWITISFCIAWKATPLFAGGYCVGDRVRNVAPSGLSPISDWEVVQPSMINAFRKPVLDSTFVLPTGATGVVLGAAGKGFWGWEVGVHSIQLTHSLTHSLTQLLPH